MFEFPGYFTYNQKDTHVFNKESIILILQIFEGMINNSFPEF